MRKRKSFIIAFIVVLATSGFSQSISDTYIRNKANPIKTSKDLYKIENIASDKKLVLLGEASHGTHEYYAWRDSITRLLITKHSYSFIAVEGDFVAIYELNKYVKNMSGAANSAKELLLGYDSWPSWIWGNKEVLNFIEWLRIFNDKLPENKKVGFYGIDVYDDEKSRKVLCDFFKDNAKEHYENLLKTDGCQNEYVYSYRFFENCSKYNDKFLRVLVDNKADFANLSDAEYFYLLQNAHVLNNAGLCCVKLSEDRKYDAWNIRTNHMFESLERILNLYGNNSKAIVWAHNSHVGDASYSDMGYFMQTSLGEIARNKYGKENVFIVGFSSYKGRLCASPDYGNDYQEMIMVPAMKNSIEEVFNRVGIESFYVIFDAKDKNNPEFTKQIDNRAIGVVYNPLYDYKQFVSTIIPLRYDSMIFFRETKAIQPLANSENKRF